MYLAVQHITIASSARLTIQAHSATDKSKWNTSGSAEEKLLDLYKLAARTSNMALE